jgi:hypothetical protein
MLLGQRFPWRLLTAIVSPALPRWRRGLPDGAAPQDQVAHSFRTGVGRKDGRQLSGSMKTGERGHLMPICRHPIAHLGPDLRRRNHVAQWERRVQPPRPGSALS